MVHQILCINQSDSCGGTGLQADIKTMQAYGCYAATVATAVSVQNTQEVVQVYPVPTEIIKKQIDAVMDDLSPTVIKTGMLGSTATIDMVGDFFDDILDGDIKIMIDPVMTSRSGALLLNKEEMDAIKRRLLVRAHVFTPNLHETEVLTGMTIKDIDDMCHAAEMLMTLGAETVVVKGGALPGETVYDVLCDEKGVEVYSNERHGPMPGHEFSATHGAGTTLAAGLAASVAQGMSPRDAFARSREYLCKAIETADVVGKGHSPVNHLIRPGE